MSEDYDYDFDPYYYENPRSYAQSSRRGGSRREPQEPGYPPQDTSAYDQSFIPRTPGSGVPQDPGSSWNPPDQVDGSNYTHYSGLSHDRFSHQGYAPGHRGLSGHQSRPGRRHANTFPEHSAPTAQLSVTRTSHSGPSPNPQPGHPVDLSSQSLLDPRYQVQSPYYFREGKVFSILWHENDGRGNGNGTILSTGGQFLGRFNEPVYSTIRRMVVVKVFEQCSWCFAISTYGGRGVAKRGVDETKHAIVYMRGTTPTRGYNEPPMTKEPLSVSSDRQEELHPMSRLNFGKIYTVEHNVKVLPIGTISSGSMTRFHQYASEELVI